MQNKVHIELFKDKKDCCGCGACINICPKKAIRMEEDEYGFLYPVIDKMLCVQCGMCKRVCGYQNNGKTQTTQKVYAAMSKDNELMKKSASGGIFAELATAILNMNGVVYGCMMEFVEGVPQVKHIAVTRQRDLTKLQGSKYVQSDMGNIYQNIREQLAIGKKVLFSGTPCQVGALKSFLGDKDIENLYTVDIICHGVPSKKMFTDYIKYIEKKLRGEIIDFKFRDKNIGWGMKGSVTYNDKLGRKKTKAIATQLSSFYQYFLNADNYRENCYSCKYACQNRVGDLTIGDYWRFGKEHPEQLIENGGEFDEEKGVSCVLINSAKGKELFDQHCKEQFLLCESRIEKIAKVNMQLSVPSQMSGKRSELLELCRTEGYEALDKRYFAELGMMKFIYMLWNALPQKLRRRIKRK